MALFSRKKKYPRPAPFFIGVFGKLPFYKDFLYSSFHPAFTDLRRLIDQGMDRLTRADHARPYIKPNRKMFFHMAKHKMDLVAYIWESDDGLRGFPFLLAAPFPRKLKNAPFSVFWQGLQAFWRYFEDFHNEAMGFSAPTELYSRVRGVQHQLTEFEIQDWEVPESLHSTSRKTAQSLDDGLLCPIDLTGTNMREEMAILKGLTPKNNPAFVLWPESSWRRDRTLAVTAYFGTDGIEDLRMDFFLPEYRDEDDALLDSLPKEFEEESVPDSEPESERAVLENRQAKDETSRNDAEVDSSEVDTQKLKCLPDEEMEDDSEDRT